MAGSRLEPAVMSSISSNAAALSILSVLIGVLTTAPQVEPVWAAPGDALFVQGNRVNVRAGPGTGEPVLMQLDKDRRVTERGRQGDWVEVAVPGSAAAGGWIHHTLVGPTAAAREALPAPPTDPKFELFDAAVAAFNRRARNRAGAHAFARVENLGEGSVQLIATEWWLGTPPAERAEDLATLLQLWDEAQDPEVPLVVRILDKGGKVVMETARP